LWSFEADDGRDTMRAGRGDIDWHFASIVVSLIWLALLFATLLAVLFLGRP